MTTIDIDQLIVDAGTQIRAELNEDRLAEYADYIDDLPPISVISDGQTSWVVDGFHRLEVFRRARRVWVPANVTTGTLRDAKLAAAKSNSTHGLERTNEDKRRAVAMLLADPEWSAWADRHIARECRVNPHLVASVRESLCAAHSSPAVRTYERADGTQVNIDTTNIGKRPAAVESAPPAEIEADLQPFAPFVAEMEGIIGSLQTQKAALIKLGDFDPVTKQPRAHWAKYFSYTIIGNLNKLIAEFRGIAPASLDSTMPFGYINRQMLDIKNGVAKKVAA